jgi:hypothetical protein
MDISSLAFVWTQLQIQHQLEKPSLAPNWNEMLKVGWEKNILIEKLTLEELALARLTFPNIVSCIIGIFFNLVRNDGKSFVCCENRMFPSWDCFLWLGWDFGYIMQKEDIITMGS